MKQLKIYTKDYKKPANIFLILQKAFCMDSSTLLYNKILQMPEDVRKQVSDFIDFMLSKKEKDNKPGESSGKKERQFGILKGKVWMSKDFDEPLEDFKDYM